MANLRPVSPRNPRQAFRPWQAHSTPRRRALAWGIFFALAGCGEPPPPAVSPEVSEIGIASYYASKFHGRRTANGELYDERAFTAAHRTLPFGTRVRITNLQNGRSVLVRINDRGPRIQSRAIDLSRKAAETLGMIRKGLAKVRIDVLDSAGGSPERNTAGN